MGYALVGSNPAVVARYILFLTRFRVTGSQRAVPARVPVAQLDKASDYESEEWGFKSLKG